MSEHAPDPTDESATPCAYTDYETAAEATETDLPRTGEDAEGVEARVWEALYDVEDPEMPVSIVDLGLIYGVDVTEAVATVEMTLTYTGCPAREMLLEDVTATVSAVEGVDEASVRLVWSPGWTVDMVTDDGKESLRDFGLSV